MNGHKPPKRQFPKSTPDVSKWKIDYNCSDTGIYNSQGDIEVIGRNIIREADNHNLIAF